MIPVFTLISSLVLPEVYVIALLDSETNSLLLGRIPVFTLIGSLVLPLIFP